MLPQHIIVVVGPNQAVEEVCGVADSLGRVQQRPVVRVAIAPAQPQAHLPGALYQVQRLCIQKSSKAISQ